MVNAYGRPAQQMAQQPASSSGMKLGSSVQGNANNQQSFFNNSGNRGFGAGLQPQVQRQGPNGNWMSPSQWAQQPSPLPNAGRAGSGFQTFGHAGNGYAEPGQTGFGGNFNYEAARDDWMGNNAYDVSSPDAARASAARWAQQHGIPYDGGDTITLPNGGGVMDVLGNFGGGKGNGQAITRNWTPAGGNGPNANGGGFASQQALSQSVYGPSGGTSPQQQQQQQGNLNISPELRAMQENALKTALGGGSMSPEVVSQMKEVQKMQALEMQKQQLQGLSQGFAGRGFSDQSGLQAALSGQVQDSTQNNILGSYRDLDINAAKTNRQDLLSGLGAMGQYVNQGLAEQGMNQDNAYQYAALAQALKIAGMQNDLGWGNLGFNYANLDSNNQWNAIKMALGL